MYECMYVHTYYDAIVVVVVVVVVVVRMYTCLTTCTYGKKYPSYL
jgi:hypothetical protein